MPAESADSGGCFYVFSALRAGFFFARSDGVVTQFVSNRQRAIWFHQKHVHEDNDPNQNNAKKKGENERSASVGAGSPSLRNRVVTLRGKFCCIFLKQIGCSTLIPFVCFDDYLLAVAHLSP